MPPKEKKTRKIRKPVKEVEEPKVVETKVEVSSTPKKVVKKTVAVDSEPQAKVTLVGAESYRCGMLVFHKGRPVMITGQKEINKYKNDSRFEVQKV